MITKPHLAKMVGRQEEVMVVRSADVVDELGSEMESCHDERGATSLTERGTESVRLLL